MQLSAGACERLPRPAISRWPVEALAPSEEPQASGDDKSDGVVRIEIPEERPLTLIKPNPPQIA